MKDHWIVGGLILLLLALNVLSILHKGVTCDEPEHFRYGWQILHGNPERFDIAQMPISAFNALLWWVVKGLGMGDGILAKTRLVMPDFPKDVLESYVGAVLGRIATICFSAFVAWVVYGWSRDLYGRRGGFLSLILYTLCPNILAHSKLTTTDLYATGLVTMVLVSFWRFSRRPSFRTWWPASAALGVAQLAKYSCILLVPILGIVLLVFHRHRLIAFWASPRTRESRRVAWRAMGILLATVLVSLVIVNAGFLFDGFGMPLKAYSFQSGPFKALQAGLGPLSRLPLPISFPYLQGLDLTLFRERTGGSFGNIYLLGHMKPLGQSFLGYYFIASFFKVPIVIQILWVAALIRSLKAPGRALWGQNTIWLTVPILFFSVYFNFFNKAQIGIRYFLVIFPLLYVFVGQVVEDWDRWSPRRRRILMGLVAYLALSVASYYPHMLSYFNEWVWDRKQAYHILADSNIDWGDNGWYLARYMSKHPDAVFEPGRPTAGRIIVGVNSLVGIRFKDREWRLRDQEDCYKWLRDHFEPVDHIAYSYLVFNVPADASLTP